MKTLAKLGCGAAVGLSLLSFAAAPAFADSTQLALSVPGNILYGTVDINRTDTTHATFLFTANTAGGYLFINGNSADLNLNATTFTLGPITGTEAPGFGPPGPLLTYTQGSGNVNGFGSFNMTLEQSDGFANGTTTISFTVTNTSGTWATVDDVLALTDKGFLAAAHVSACGTDPATIPLGCTNTFFVANGGFPGGSNVLEPNSASLAVLALGLLGAGFWTRRKV